MKNFIEIISEPFYLRPLLESHLDEIHAIWTNGQVRRYLFDDIIIPIEATLEEIKNSILSFEQNKYGLWVVFFKNASKMIGFTGYRNFHEPPELQLIYGLLPDYCGKGYATILAKLMLKYGFEELKFDEIVASADVPNVASIKVMQKSGMRFEKQVVIDGLDTIYYKLENVNYKPEDITLLLKRV